MRPRINKGFSNITRLELNDWLYNNKIYGLTADSSFDDKIIYKNLIMYRNNKKDPEELFYEVSKASKKIIKVYTKDKEFKSFEELKNTFQLK